MNRPISNFLGGAAGVVCAAAVTAAIAATGGSTYLTTGLGDNVTVDATPPNREANNPMAGYSAVISKAAPSVVSVLSSKTAQPVTFNGRGTPQGLEQLRELFGDDQLRQFFGNQLPGQNERQQRTPRMPKQEGQGSGVILTEDGYILTNNHVIDRADDIRIVIKGYDEEFEAELIGADAQSDIAVLKIDATGLPAATLGDNENLLPGDTVLAIGNPFGLQQTITSGIVSATGRTGLNIAGYEDFIQTDASINPGNSGGALIDNQGRVVGINTAIFSRTGGNIGIGFAIPVNMAMEIADDLIRDGEVTRGFLGIQMGKLTNDLAAALNLDENDGIIVNDVVPDSPAAKAGLKPADVITSFEGKPVTTMARLRLQVGSTEPGDKAEVEIVRDGKEKTLKVEIGELPNSERNLMGHAAEPAKAGNTIPGVELTPLNDAARERFGLDRSVEGLIVTEVDPDSAAAEAGLVEGSIITEIGRESVSTMGDVTDAVEDAENERLLLRVKTPQGTQFIALDLRD